MVSGVKKCLYWPKGLHMKNLIFFSLFLFSATSFASGFSDCYPLGLKVQGWGPSDAVTACHKAGSQFLYCYNLAKQEPSWSVFDRIVACHDADDSFKDCYATAIKLPGANWFDTQAACR